MKVGDLIRYKSFPETGHGVVLDIDRRGHGSDSTLRDSYPHYIWDFKASLGGCIMQIGDLVRMNEGVFMQGLMGIIVDHHIASDGCERWLVQFIGPDVPKSLQHRSVPFRASRFTLIKSSTNSNK